MAELETGDDLDYKVAFLTFVNTMIVQGQSIKERVKVREDFMLERITDILAVLYPTPNFESLPNNTKIVK
jgi:hypothetical protein